MITRFGRSRSPIRNGVRSGWEDSRACVILGPPTSARNAPSLITMPTLIHDYDPNSSLSWNHSVRLRCTFAVASGEHTLLSWHRCLTSMGPWITLRHLCHFLVVAETSRWRGSYSHIGAMPLIFCDHTVSSRL